MMLIGWLLVVEAASTGLWIAQVVALLPAYGPLVTGLVAIRGFIAALQLAGGVFLLGHRPSAVFVARWALVLSAALTTLETGFRLAPSNLQPSLRWPLVAAYWAYAIGAVWYLSARLGDTRDVPVDRIAPPVAPRPRMDAPPPRPVDRRDGPSLLD